MLLCAFQNKVDKSMLQKFDWFLPNNILVSKNNIFKRPMKKAFYLRGFVGVLWKINHWWNAGSFEII